MTTAPEPDLAASLGRLLLGDACPAPTAEAEWAEFLQLAVSNGVVIRALDRLQARGTAVPPSFAAVIEAQRTRARQMFEAMSRVAELCTTHGLDWCYPKAAERLPDIGRDLDLLVAPGSERLDGLLRRELGAVPLARGFRSELTGSTQYHVPSWPAPLDVQQGRLGVAGEHSRFPAELLRRSAPIEIAGCRFMVPRGEDRLVHQGLQMIYGRDAIRLTDVVSTVTLVRGGDLDWDDITGTATRAGIVPGLSCYLTYVDQIHGALFGTPLAGPPQARRLMEGRWGRVTFARGRYRFPTVAVNARLYLRRLVSDFAHGRWASAARLCLLPGIAVAAVGGRVSRRLDLSAPPSGSVAS
jgi:Uncharacterised nucleotidyltransferase